MPIEQRFPSESSRFTISLPVQILDPLSGKRITGETKNISRGGCFVLTEGTLDIGTVVQLRIERDRSTFQSLASVTRVLPAQGLAFAFLGTESLELNRLRTWFSGSDT